MMNPYILSVEKLEIWIDILKYIIQDSILKISRLVKLQSSVTRQKKLFKQRK